MEEPRPKADGRPVPPTIMIGGFTPVDLAWKEFSRRHERWLGRIPPGPLYCLADEAIARLEHLRLDHPPLLNADDAAAERDLLALCLRVHAVGFEASKPIIYPYLDRSPKRSFRDDFPNHGWTEAQWTEVQLLEGKAATASFRLKGYAGWLTTERPFLDDAAGLQARWAALPDRERPSFPLRRTVSVVLRPGEVAPPPASEAVAAYAEDYDAFCDRWGLLGMATWDLPEPQGPFFPSLLPPGAPALPRHGVHIILPLHYPLTHDDDLLRQILAFQRGLAARCGLDHTAAGLPHHEAYATILEIVHWERVITGRYGGGPRRRGFVGLVVEAVAEAIGREENLVEKWRKAVSACRRGKRSRVKALRPAVDRRASRPNK
jgi:hypothetical protein